MVSHLEASHLGIGFEEGYPVFEIYIGAFYGEFLVPDLERSHEEAPVVRIRGLHKRIHAPQVALAESSVEHRLQERDRTVKLLTGHTFVGHRIGFGGEISVSRAPHATLYLKGGYPCAPEPVHGLHPVDVGVAEEVPVALRQMVLLPAGLGAFASVAAPAAHDAREQASSGHGVAHGSLYEDLRLHGRVPDYFLYLVQSKLPCQYGTAYAVVSAPLQPFLGMYPHLSGGVLRYGYVLNGIQKTQILDYNCICAYVLEELHIGDGGPHLRILDDGVHGDVDFDTVPVGVIHGTFHLRIGEILGESPGPETGPTHVNGIASAFYRCYQSLGRSRRCKNFHALLFSAPVIKAS